ncbi:DUF2249 domain-containing protein [Chitinibacter sp. FCG-7]|uniref:DUF2249 domain-containing protein n=1 Tax=Chitinibacter mangrovi TaxID=3153927 RepID=A0AAU7F9G4_9NEIS
MHALIDLRQLAPPEPIERILHWLDTAEPGQIGLFHLPHVPYPLYEHLHMRPCHWECDKQADGSAILQLVRDQ